MPSKSLEDACSFLRDAIPVIQDKYRARYGAAMFARVGEVLRTDEEQKLKYAQGRTLPGRIVTYANGVDKRSAHQGAMLHDEDCSHAVDIDIISADGKRYITDERFYVPLVGLCISVGIQSGGEWMNPDWPHCFCPFAKP